ncbi:uncharacterized protein si:ch211-196c10.15 [Esox lucius]|uniref:uncharacterized protein si:ch211-196c10.15 n=1 Tax=Esox lucius TaxID=8010 RepID=UPI001476FD96|nr:uncharacterized protein si:ch211-196c10.15 [Esox lucius]
MVANVTRLVELNATEIKEYKVKIQVIEKEMPHLVKDEELKDKVTEMERYKRRWNLKIHAQHHHDLKRCQNCPEVPLCPGGGVCFADIPVHQRSC